MQKMERLRKFIALVLAVVLFVTATLPSAQAACIFDDWKIGKNKKYTVSDTLQSELNRLYNRYDFSIGWGVYDISGKKLKTVATRNSAKSYQSNCTIKAPMLMYICQKMDKGELSLSTKLSVNTSKLHYTDFGNKSGKYTVEYLLRRMINVSNNACYEVFLRYVTRSKFNSFLSSLGSGTVITSYNYMGNCTVQDRAVEWFELYKYCHSGAAHASHAWSLLTNAQYSPIRDGLGCTVAHKSGWHYEEGVRGTAGDCAVVKAKNGGCYLMIMFTKNNARAKYSEKLMRELAVILNKVWNEYYADLPKRQKKTAAF